MTILTDSMAREHQAEIQALVRNNHRAREARLVRRAQRQAQRQARRATPAGSGGAGAAERSAHAGRTVRDAVTRPFAAAQHWLVAGQL